MKSIEKIYQKFILIASVIFLMISFLVFIFLRKHEVAVSRYKFDSSTVVKEGYQFVIDDVTDNNGYAISGWLIKEGTDIGTINRTVVLKDKTSKKYLEIATEVVYRPDLEAYLGDGINYSDSGFYAIVPDDEIVKKHDYEVFIIDESDNDKKTVKVSDSLKGELKN